MQHQLLLQTFSTAVGRISSLDHTVLQHWLIDWLIEQGLTSPPTQNRLSGRRFYRSKEPTKIIKVLLKDQKNTQITQKYNKPRRRAAKNSVELDAISRTVLLVWETMVQWRTIYSIQHQALHVLHIMRDINPLTYLHQVSQQRTTWRQTEHTEIDEG